MDYKLKQIYDMMNGLRSMWTPNNYAFVTNQFYEATRRIKNISGYWSEQAFLNVDNNHVKKENDHIFPMSVVGRYIMDNADKYLNDPSKFEAIIKLCSTTIVVTKEENTKLSKQTKSRGASLKLTCSLIDKYDEAEIRLKGPGGWVDEFPFTMPESYLQYEKQFLM